MDKYTVDLDQVLNDFEYSELTTEQPHAQEPTSSVSTTTTAKNYSSTKHSINNVFSSLNEYLNSEIADNKYDNNLHLQRQSSSVKEIVKEIIEIDQELQDEHEEEQEHEEEEEHFVDVEEGPTVQENNIIGTPVKSTPLETLIAEPITLKIDDEHRTNHEEPSEEVHEEEIIEIHQERGQELQENVENLVEIHEIVEKIVATETENCDKIGFDNVIVDDAEAQQYLEELELLTNHQELKQEESSEKLLKNEVKIEEIAEANLETQATCLEEEPQITMRIEPIDVAEVATTAAAATISKATKSKKIDLLRPNSLDIKEEPAVLGNPGSTPYNTHYIGETATQIHDSELDEASEASASVSPTFSEASTESVRSNNNNENTDNTQHVEETETSEDTETAIADEDLGTTAEQVEQRQDGVASDPEGEDDLWLGKRAPLWIPDADALTCQHCDLKFTVIKRRHHCRACGLVLCSKCCGMKRRLEYLNGDARVCTRCYDILDRETDSGSGDSQTSTPSRSNIADGGAQTTPNPNNPMEYCSLVPPHQQAAGDSTPPSVMVPVGVLKRKGSNKKHNKSVMFCDGIRPGSDLTHLDNDFNYNDKATTTAAATAASAKPTNLNKKASQAQQQQQVAATKNKNLPPVDPVTQSFIPENENCLPPTITTFKSDITYTECGNNANVVEMLKNETLTFAVQRNLHIHVRLITMNCCVNKQAWCFTTEGLIAVGQDEIVILLEYIENETQVPKDVFHHLNNMYNSAVKGTTVTELGLSIHPTTNFLNSRNHAGFIFVRPTFQCVQNMILPKEPYLVGVLVHKWETPWARIFPLRLVLRLGAEYRYYPSPLISTRQRDSVFVEIGHTIINLLADFRNFSYTLPNIRGLTIHMEEKSTTVSIPANRYDQVMKSIGNSSEHILAFGGNFSTLADSHLVCIQDTQGSNENSYKTHAINIQNKPRKVTGASFIVFNGALKSSSGLTAKSSIVEDGLMIQIPPEHMIQVRESLRNMKNHTIQCGCVNAASDETVNIVWSEPDVNFNIGVTSSVDGQTLSGVPSIRVHNGKDYPCTSGVRLIRWTEVFLLQSGEENARTQDPVDISKVAESISKATCQALEKYLDLLATNNFVKIGIRTTLHVDDVSYSAGSNGTKLPPIYMKSLDNELVPVLHRITSSGNVGDGTIVLELIFRILNV